MKKTAEDDSDRWYILNGLASTGFLITDPTPKGDNFVSPDLVELGQVFSSNYCRSYFFGVKK